MNKYLKLFICYGISFVSISCILCFALVLRYGPNCIDDNPCYIEKVYDDGSILVNRYIHNREVIAKPYRSHINGMEHLNGEQVKHIINSKQIALDYICAALLPNGTLGIVYMDSKGNLSELPE